MCQAPRLYGGYSALSPRALLNCFPTPGISLVLEASPFSVCCADSSVHFASSQKLFPDTFYALISVSALALCMAHNRHVAIWAFWPLSSLQILKNCDWAPWNHFLIIYLALTLDYESSFGE